MSVKFQILQVPNYKQPSASDVKYDTVFIGNRSQSTQPTEYLLHRGIITFYSYSLDELSQRLASCHSGTPRVHFANIVTDDEFLAFLRSVDPKCFSGNVATTEN